MVSAPPAMRTSRPEAAARTWWSAVWRRARLASPHDCAQGYATEFKPAVGNIHRARNQRQRTTMTGFLHPQYLVSTEWLAAHLDDPAVVILDCTTHLIPN